MITILTGGSGSAKFVRGLSKVLSQEKITAVVNVGDNIELFGLYVCPDIDTIMYALAGVLDIKKGWGLEEDTFKLLEMLQRYGLETWFRLGDKDVATHIHRTFLLNRGHNLSQITKLLSTLLGIKAKILPATDERIETKVVTKSGRMHLQEFWVKRKAQDEVLDVIYEGIEEAKPAVNVLESIKNAEGIIISPANPVTSIEPILEVNGIREALIKRKEKTLAISPIIGNDPVSGPAGKLIHSLGIEVSASSIAELYEDILGTIIIDNSDIALKEGIEKIGIKCVATNTLMKSFDDEKRLADVAVEQLGVQKKRDEKVSL
ncbi:MAG: 2-phospho-L-lactate transferase [Candidatus Bathyarchaeota archaeon]